MAALIPVVFMLVVKVAIVYVVDVVTVGDGNVPATRTVLVRVILVNDVLSSHSAQPSCAFIDAADTLRALLSTPILTTFTAYGKSLEKESEYLLLKTD